MTSTKHAFTCKQEITWSVSTAFITVIPDAQRARISTNILQPPPHPQVVVDVNLLCEVRGPLVCLSQMCIIEH